MSNLAPFLLLVLNTLLLVISLSGKSPSQTCSSSATREIPELIYSAIAEGKTGIRIPPGRYYVKPDYGTHLRLENVHNFTIEASGVEMVCSETTRAILIENCTDITIRGLTIDYDPLPYTQGKIVSISEDRKSHIIRIEEGYAQADKAIVFKHLIYKPDGNLRFGSYHRMQLEVLPDNHLRVYDLNPAKDGGEQVGDTVVISSEHLIGRYDPHAVHIYNSLRTTLEDVTLYASPCFGLFDEHSSETVYLNCVIDRREGRLHSLNADGFHSKFAKIGPKLDGCRAMWMGDDGINICGSYHIVMHSQGNKLRVLSKRGLDIELGDPVQLLASDGTLLPDARVVSIKPAGVRNESDIAKLKKLPLLPMIADLLQNAYIIELDRAVSIEAGGVIGSLNRMGNGFSITNCEFGNIRSRGILIKASNGIIANNRVINCHLQGIKISPEYYWLESGTSRNLRVENNQIINSKAESILIDTIGSARIHRDIHLVRNRIVSDCYPQIRIRGLEGGSLRKNVLSDTEGNSAPESAISIEHSSNLRR